MRQTVAMLLCLLLAVPLVGCSEKKLPEQKAEAAERIDSRLAAANTDFAFRLFARCVNLQVTATLSFHRPVSPLLWAWFIMVPPGNHGGNGTSHRY